MRGTQGDFNSVTSVYVLSWIMDSWMLVSLFPIHFVCRKYGLILFKREKFKLETNREGVYISGTLLFGQESKLLVPPPYTPTSLFSLHLLSAGYLWVKRSSWRSSIELICELLFWLGLPCGLYATCFFPCFISWAPYYLLFPSLSSLGE